MTSREYHVNCVKRNMYDPDLEYIAISYRWGELNEQLVVTPDYTAHITSFNVLDLMELCNRIKYEPDLKHIPYLWIDAISVDQQNKERKKETILKMNQIYKNATYILAVPDLHMEYLMKNTANKEKLELIDRYKYSIYDELFTIRHSPTISITEDMNSSVIDSDISQPTKNNHYSFIQKLTSKKIIKKNEELKLENKEMREGELKQKKNELKRVYQFLAYLVDDWSNRSWVISEYHIAKEKYKKHGTPLKYIFRSLLIKYKYFFSYHFDDGDQQQRQYSKDNKTTNKSNKRLNYTDVDGPKTFNQFVKERFMQRTHLEMILSSNTARNEDRFNAILPSWDKYNGVIKNRNTISEWNITGMTAVRLKLYEIMNDGDLWEKAKLLYTSFQPYSNSYKVIFPTYASHCYTDKLKIIEKANYNDPEYKEFEEELLKYIKNWMEEKDIMQMKQHIDKYKINSKPLWNENLTSIQFKQSQGCLSVKSNSYFIKNEASYSMDYFQRKLSLEYHEELHCAFIPFFTFTLSGYTDFPHIYSSSSII
ncbi:unnamed protein product [Cunninghamella blakesleeana]